MTANELAYVEKWRGILDEKARITPKRIVLPQTDPDAATPQQVIGGRA